MSEECDKCGKEFSNEKEKLEHELDEHGDELSSHDKSDKKNRLNKLEEKQKTKKQNRKQKIKYTGMAAVLGVLVIGGGVFSMENIDTSMPVNESIGLGEPIHWHADYQITVCGEEKIPRGGPMLAHTHGETRFHLEGVRRNSEQTTLGWVLNSLGVQFSEDSIYGKSSCGGEPADLTFKANGQNLENPGNYTIRDGDRINIKLE